MAADATQYLLPDGIGLDAALGRLAARFDLAVGPAGPVERTFYDTFDGRLHAAGLALIAIGGELVAAAGPSYRELARAPVAGSGGRFFAADLADGALRDLVEPLVEVRALLPIASTRGRVLRAGVLDGERKTVVRLVLEDGEAGLRSRVHVVGVRGYDRALGRVQRAVVKHLDLAPSDVRLDDEAVRAAGGRPGGTQTKLDLHLEADGPAAGGVAIALGEMLRTIELTLPGTLADVDSEFLHDLRVAVRRTRSVQRQLSAAFPVERLRGFRDEFRWLGQVTGPTRDLDVLLLDLVRLRADLPADRGAELAPLGDLLGRRRERERRRMAAALGSERAASLLSSWSAFLADPGEGAQGRRPLGEVVGGRIRAVYRQMRLAGTEIDGESPAERLHDLRKLGKELRYLLEMFASLYPAEAVRPTVRSLKALQETLGQFQDREVQATTLRGLGDDLAGAPGGTAALLALGVVLERVSAESGAARAEFAERFAVFAAPGQRALIRDSFR